MPTPDNAKLIEGQRQDWNRVAGGWEKWDRLHAAQTKEHPVPGPHRPRRRFSVAENGVMDINHQLLSLHGCKGQELRKHHLYVT